MTNATELKTKELETMQLSDQLWTVYFDSYKFHCIGILELSNDFLKKMSSVDFDKDPPMAFMKMAKMPEDREAYLNMLTDLLIIACCPNIFLFLEALHENKSQEIQDFHMNVYERTQKSISPSLYKGSGEDFKSLDRVNKPFKWTSNEKGFLINQHGQKIIKFADPKLAKWVSLAGSQFAPLFGFVFGKTLARIGAGPMISMKDGSVSLDTMEGKAERETKESYLEMKEMLKDLDWDIYKNLKNMKIFLE